MLTIYKASAGSGKTFQLALYYLKMVLGVKEPGAERHRLNPNLLTDAPSRSHRGILAITFTNKATEEMKTRIVESLNTIAHAKSPDDHKYIEELIDEFGCTFEELQKAAGRAMVSLLLDFTFFNVSTIDSFFQTVLRTFARELGVQGDYNIEIDSTDAIGNALNMLLDELNGHTAETEDEMVRRIRRWFDREAGDRDGKYNPFRRQSKDFKGIVAQIKKIFTEDFKPLQQELYNYLARPDLLDRFRRQLHALNRNIAPDVISALDDLEAGLQASEQYDFIIKNTRTLIDNLRADPETELFGQKMGVGIERLLKGEKEIGKGEYKLLKKNIPNETYESAMDTFAERLRHLYLPVKLARLLLSKTPQLEFIGLILKYINQLREDENLLILDDTSTYISRIINGSEIPFIYEHLGNRLHHFLIDEFQDTSRLQWDNLLPLVNTAQAEGNDSLIIGDIKQAIYRFRNSDATLLGQRLENVDFPYAETRRVLGNLPAQNCNYRTAHGIVRFNNTILPELAKFALDDPNPQGYTGAQILQMCAAETAHLDAKIKLFPCNILTHAEVVKRAQKMTAEQLPPPYDIKGDMLVQPVIEDRETRIAVIIEQIRRQHDVEKFKWNDIAILYRFNTNISRLVEELLNADIPLQSQDNLFLRNASSIKLIVALLTMLADAGMPEVRKNSRDEQPSSQGQSTDHLLFESRYNFFRYYSNPDGEALAPEEAIRKAIDLDTPTEITAKKEIDVKNTTNRPTTADPNKNDGSNAVLSLDAAIDKILAKHPATLVAIIEAILSTGLIPEPIIQKEKDYIATFTDLAGQYSESGDGGDLPGFLAWWEIHQEKASIVPPPDCDAVRLMTIHGSKGLEFKCVHLVDFNWKLVDERESAWIDIRPHASGAQKGVPNVPVGLPFDPPTIPPLFCFDLSASQIGFPSSPFESYLRKQQREMRIDAFNVAYVGLTRAQNQLSVYFDWSPRAKSITTIGQALAAALCECVENPPSDPLCSPIPANAINPDTLAMHIEVPAPKVLTPDEIADKLKKQADKKAAEELNRAESALYNSAYNSYFRSDVSSIVNVDSLNPDVFIDEDIDDTDDMPEGADDTPETLDSDAETATSRSRERLARRKRMRSEHTVRGVDLHEILARIRTLPDTDSETIARAFDKAFDGVAALDGFNAEARGNYALTIDKMLGNTETARWFDPANRIFTEVTYLTTSESTNGDKQADKDKPRFISRRIDRLVQMSDGSFEVVDYKFTKTTDALHISQVRDYVEAIRAMNPGAEVRGYLWYVDLDKISTVS